MTDLTEVIGNNLKELRQEMGYSLDKLSDLTGVSKTMLGQIERGESNPTINTIWKIANGLRVTFSRLIKEKESEVELLRRDDMLEIFTDEPHYKVYSIIEFNPDNHFDLYLVELDPLSEHESPAHNPNVEEHILVHQGTLEIYINNTKHVLNSGDFIRFKPNQVHTYSNPSDTLTRYSDFIYYSSN